MPSITPPDHHLIPIQRPLPQAYMVWTTRVQEIVARVTATLRSSGLPHLVAFVEGWRVSLQSQGIHGSSSGFGSGHSGARLSSRPRSFAGVDTTLLAAVANTASSSPGCYGQHAVQVPW